MHVSRILLPLGAASIVAAANVAHPVRPNDLTAPALTYTGSISTIETSAPQTDDETSSIASQLSSESTSAASTPSTSDVSVTVTPSTSPSSSADSTLVPSSTDSTTRGAAPNATTSKPADATAGAVLSQMQGGSMVGLLGFCIMSLIML